MRSKILILAICFLLCACNDATPTPVHPTVVTETPTADVCGELVNLWTIVNWQQSNYLAAMPTLVAVETRIAELQATTCGTPVSTVTPTSVHTPAPTSTPGHTPTPEPTTSALCSTCTKGCVSGTPGCCPLGYVCYNCYSAGFRCVRVTSPNADSLTCRGINAAVVESWEGLATWYGAQYLAMPMKNGELFDPEAYTCAVPAERWDELRGKTLTACASACVDVLVTDTFYARHNRLDLSRRSFQDLADLAVGVIEVDVWLLQ